MYGDGGGESPSGSDGIDASCKLGSTIDYMTTVGGGGVLGFGDILLYFMKLLFRIITQG